MASTAVLLALMGLCLTFLPGEIAGYFLPGSTIIWQLFIQVLGALYLAFAMLNWMTKENVMGGIYNRPIAIANLTHFLIGALALVKGLMKHPDLPWAVWTMAGLYALFALFFGMVFFRSPVRKKELTTAS